MQTLIILGRQPALGIAELESLYGPDNLQPVGNQAVLIDMDPISIEFNRLGGMVKFCKVLTTLDTTKWIEIQKYLEITIPNHLHFLPEGKLRLGLSIYGLDVSVKKLQSDGLSLKKLIRASGKSVRYVPNAEPALNAAQVLHNQLTSKLGWELVFVRDKNKTIIAQSIAVQDIESYTRRDQARPCRDAKVGMLPPKLAQIIVNLAAAKTEASDNHVILDPFSGTGVILQEANLMKFTNLYATDKDPRMVDYTCKNLAWLMRTFNVGHTLKTAVADATINQWDGNFHTIASETYLGKPFSTLLDKELLDKVIGECDYMHRKFLINLKNQVRAGFRMSLAVPAWRSKYGFRHLPTLDKLEELGYNRVKFIHASDEDLIYHRPDQIVARELVVLEKV